MSVSAATLISFPVSYEASIEADNSWVGRPDQKGVDR